MDDDSLPSDVDSLPPDDNGAPDDDRVSLPDSLPDSLPESLPDSLPPDDDGAPEDQVQCGSPLELAAHVHAAQAFAEFYSVPRVGPLVAQIGYKAEISADIKTGWDFTAPQCQERSFSLLVILKVSFSQSTKLCVCIYLYIFCVAEQQMLYLLIGPMLWKVGFLQFLHS